MVEYIYDSWGKLIATTGSLANTVGANQPFRYRGYVYDEETGWYYLRSRYYDPTTCRFISADVLLSTGQGVIGHNSFAYCLNNPLILEDQGGAAAHFNNTVAVCDGGCDSRPRYPKSWEELNEGLAYYGIKNDKPKKAFTNNPQDVIDRANSGKWFSVYKGTLVIHTEWNLFPSSCYPGPFIIIDKEQRCVETLNHEYGHSIQFRILGPRYYTKIAVPSVVGCFSAEKNKWLYDNYYSQPWEVTADMLGGVVNRVHAKYSEEIGILYLLIP